MAVHDKHGPILIVIGFMSEKVHIQLSIGIFDPLSIRIKMA